MAPPIRTPVRVFEQLSLGEFPTVNHWSKCLLIWFVSASSLGHCQKLGRRKKVVLFSCSFDIKIVRIRDLRFLLSEKNLEKYNTKKRHSHGELAQDYENIVFLFSKFWLKINGRFWIKFTSWKSVASNEFVFARACFLLQINLFFLQICLFLFQMSLFLL